MSAGCKPFFVASGRWCGWSDAKGEKTVCAAPPFTIDRIKSTFWLLSPEGHHCANAKALDTTRIPGCYASAPNRQTHLARKKSEILDHRPTNINL